MQQLEVINILKKRLNFSDHSIEKLKRFTNLVLEENKNYNLISKSTENEIWHRHVLDSAQLVKFIDFNLRSLADLGTGAGFPGLVLEIFNKIKELGLNAEVLGNVRDEVLDSDIIISRAFKKLNQVIQVSREIARKPHKLLILKGQNAQKELNNSFKTKKYPYKLENSMTNKDSKIILMEINK